MGYNIVSDDCVCASNAGQSCGGTLCSVPREAQYWDWGPQCFRVSSWNNGPNNECITCHITTSLRSIPEDLRHDSEL